MPEGPEIRRAADQIAAVLENRKVVEVSFSMPSLRHYKRRLQGARVTRVRNHGKALLTSFDNGWTIYSHNQLYGLWVTCPRSERPKTSRTLRLALHTTTHSALLYSATEISVWCTEELPNHPFLKTLGPDVLDNNLSWRDVAKRLRSPAFCNRSLTQLYLDQRFIAGIGNYLRSEILFDAAIHPWQKPSELPTQDLNRLARSTLSISHQSYAKAGVTNRPDWVRRAKTQDDRFESFRFMVFDREDLPCYACGTEIQNTPANSRRLYWCKDCQQCRD